MSPILHRLTVMNTLRPLAALCCVAALFAAGCTGNQAPQLTEEEAKILKMSYPEESEVILIMDYSIGMAAHDKKMQRIQAAKAFVDMLSDETHLAVMSYSEKVDYLTDDFLDLGDMENREKAKELLDGIENDSGAWKNVSGAFLDVKWYYDATFNRELIKKREQMKAEGIETPKRRRHMVIIFDGDRHLDLHSDDAVSFRYKDGTYGYFYDILNNPISRQYKLHSVALTEKAENHFTRSIATLGQGSFHVAEDANGLMDAYANIAAEIDNLIEITGEPLELAKDGDARVAMPCFADELVVLAHAAKDDAEPVAEGATFPSGEVNLNEPTAGRRISRGEGYMVMRLSDAKCGDYTFKGASAGTVRAWAPAPFLLKEHEMKSSYIVNAEAEFAPEFYDRETKIALYDEAERGKLKVQATFTNPVGEATVVDLKPVIPEEGVPEAFHFVGSYTVTDTFKKPKKGRLSRSERMHTKGEDTRMDVVITYTDAGKEYTKTFNRFFRAVDAPRMVFARDSVPRIIEAGENVTFKVHFEQEGEMIVDKEFRREKVDVFMDLEHLKSGLRMRKMEIQDSGGSGDETRGDGIFTRKVRMAREWSRNQLPEEDQPGRYDYRIYSILMHKGQPVEQEIEGFFVMKEPPEQEL